MTFFGVTFWPDLWEDPHADSFSPVQRHMEGLRNAASSIALLPPPLSWLLLAGANAFGLASQKRQQGSVPQIDTTVMPLERHYAPAERIPPPSFSVHPAFNMHQRGTAMKKTNIQLGLMLLAVAVTSFDVSAQTNDASKWTRPNIGFAKPPASQADNVPATGIQGQVTGGQIGTIDGSQVLGTVPQAANALNAQQAQTAATAQGLDPNATIDPSKLNLTPCTGGKVLTVKAGSGLECVLAGSGSMGFANKLYFNTTNQTWTVPDDVFQIRLTAAAGNTVQYRQTYGVTSYSWGVVSQTSLGAYCWGDDSGSGCACNGSPDVGYPHCLKNNYGNIANYGCLTPTQTTVPKSSGSKTFAVTPGQLFRAILASTQTPVSVAAPHNSCPSNYDVNYTAIAEVPADAPVPNVYFDKRNGENAGEMSVTNAMIVEW